MKNTTVLKRYVNALFESLDKADLKQVSVVLLDIANSWRDEYTAMLLHPALPFNQKVEALESIVKLFTSEEKVVNFFKILLENKVFDFLTIADLFEQRLRKEEKERKVTVTTANELSEDDKSSIKGKLLNAFKTNSLQIEWRTDPLLIAGVLIEAEDKIFDGTVAGAIKQGSSQLLK